jgi:glycosyltransferase 2 family protein
MKRLVSRLVAGIVVGVAVYVGFTIWADVGRVGEALRKFHWGWAALACLLAAANYAVRFLRWQFYLGRVGVRNVSVRDSLQVFLAGFALTVTPGKLGEMVKAALLRASHRIPMAKTAPIVIAERVTDLVALLLLALVGVFSYDVDRRFLVAGAVLVAAGLTVVSVDPVAKAAIALAGRLPVLRRFAHRLDEAHAHTAILLAPLPLIVTTALATVSWFFECLAFWIVVHGFPGAHLGLQGATFVYAATTVAGALSFLPGGLGMTEAGMLALLLSPRLGAGIDKGAAAAATVVTRVATLWFAVALGLPMLLLYARRKHVNIDADVARPEPANGLP